MEASIGVNLRVTAHSNQGGRKYMEDMFCVAYQPTSDERDLLYAYFGIFDGHGGREAAMYAKQHLMDFIVSQKNFWSDDDELVMKAIRDGFMATHYAMWKELENWPKTASGLPSTSGTTASIVFVRRGKMYIGHVGDSAIILGLQDPDTNFWRAKPLTRDHKPESAVENARITQSGGKVITKSGVPRVVWNRPRLGHKGPVRRSTHIDEIPFLAVARSLGDLWSYNSVQNEFVVSPVPDVSVIDIDVNIHRCIILGSDGLWNMLNPQDAVNSVYYAERNNERQLLSSPPEVSSSQVKNWINPSKRLVDRALDRWLNHNLRADNTSVVTVVIDPPGPPKAQVLRQNLNRTHVVRQSVSSVTDPATSKTVPAMVLAPISGQKQPQPSPFSQPGGSRGLCAPVSSSAGSKPESRSSVSGSDASKSCSSLPLASSSRTAESSSNDAKTKRILLKRKLYPDNEAIRNNRESVTSVHSAVSCSTPNSSTTEAGGGTKRPCEESAGIRSQKNKNTSEPEIKDTKTSHDDVQIHEISSSSEAKSNYSIAECTPESGVKRRKTTRSSAFETTPTTHHRPLTRQSTVLGHPKEARKTLKSRQITPISHTRSLRRVPAIATPAVKDVVRRSLPSLRCSKGHEPSEVHSHPRALAKSKFISSSVGELGRSLRSGTKAIKRITRSMKK